MFSNGLDWTGSSGNKKHSVTRLLRQTDHPSDATTACTSSASPVGFQTTAWRHLRHPPIDLRHKSSEPRQSLPQKGQTRGIRSPPLPWPNQPPPTYLPSEKVPGVGSIPIMAFTKIPWTTPWVSLRDTDIETDANTIPYLLRRVGPRVNVCYILLSIPQ